MSVGDAMNKPKQLKPGLEILQKTMGFDLEL